MVVRSLYRPLYRSPIGNPDNAGGSPGGSPYPYAITAQRAIIQPDSLDNQGAWYKPGDAASVTATGTNLTGLADKFGNTSRNLIGVNNPQYDSVNGTVTTNGSNNYLYHDDPFMYDASGCTIFFVVKGISAATGVLLSENNSSDDDPLYNVIAGSGSNDNSKLTYRSDAGGAALSVDYDVFAYDNNTKVIRLQDNGSNITAFEHGVERETVSYTRATTTLSRFAIGAVTRPSIGGYLAAEILEVIIYEDILTEEEAAGIEAYLYNEHFSQEESLFMIGQSNTDGRGANGDLDSAISTFFDTDRPELQIYYKPTVRDDGEVSNVTAASFTDDGEWYELDKDHDDPTKKTHQTVGFASSTVATQTDSLHGVELAYAYNFAQDNSGDDLWIFKGAVSAAGLEEDFLVEDAATNGLWYYIREHIIHPALIDMRNEGKTPKSGSKVFIYQGEKDSNTSAAANEYGKNLQFLLNRLVTDLPVIGLDVVLVQLSATYDTTNGTIVKNAQAAAASANSNVTLLKTDGTDGQSAIALSGDTIHHTAAGYKEIADRAYAL